MKRKIGLILLLFLSGMLYSQEGKSFYVASWNMENLFDVNDDPGKNDSEFLPEGKKNWTQERLEKKLDNMAQVIAFMNDGNGPDILGVQEVEHQSLLEMLLQRELPKKNYKIAYAESLDGRGIDNGLIYNADFFSLISIETLRVDLNDKYPTRYVFLASLVTNRDDTLHCFVNHWPSRRGGEEKSRPNRLKAASVLNQRVNGLLSEQPKSNIFIMGDFNDEPNNLSIDSVLAAKHFGVEDSNLSEALYNLAYKAFKEGAGSYRYKQDWNMLDQMIVSSNVVLKSRINYVENSFEVIKPDFAITKDGYYQGTIIPTYGGRKYLGGYSDHYPVGAKFLMDF